jgi:hypothetical protein
MSSFFIQYNCGVGESNIHKKYEDVALVSAVFMFIALLFIVLIHFMLKTSKLEEQRFDMNTITAGDYTVELDITREMYQYFLDSRY